MVRVVLAGLVRAHWTDQIHDEWTRNVLANRPELAASSIERSRQLMDAHVHDALVTGYEDLVPTLSLPDSDDRHVLAAAVRIRATVIVTFNLSDFSARSPPPVERRSRPPGRVRLPAACGIARRSVRGREPAAGEPEETAQER